MLLLLACAPHPAPPGATTSTPTPVIRRPLDELLAADDAWSGYVHPLLGTAEIVPTTEARGRAALWEMQVTQGSALGAMALHCAAVRVDGGWLTLLGAGDPASGFAGLPEWNGTSEAVPLLVRRGFLIVGYDAVGGFFAVDDGGIRGRTRHVA